MEPVDFSAFIGRDPDNERVYVATGDSGQGMTHGALAGPLLKDLIVNRESPWEDVYEPSRKTPSGLLNVVRESISVVTGLFAHVAPGEVDSVDEIEAGKGAIVRSGKDKIAAYRDDSGKLHQHSAACTHMGCEVKWNSTEGCWDCQCHGSQFSPLGEVLNGPAVTPLAAVKGSTAGAKTKVRTEA
jgi:hypothetical protein